MTRPNLLFLSLLISISPALASADEGWDFRAAPYLWAMGIDGNVSIGSIVGDVDVDFGDILENMDIGGSLFVAGRKGRHGFHVDYTYIKLEAGKQNLAPPRFSEGSTISPEITSTVLEAAYNLYLDVPDNEIVLMTGFRSFDVSVKLRPSVGDPIKVEPDTLRDFFVGMRWNFPFGDRWAFSFQGTVGMGDTDSPWTMQGLFSREVHNGNRLAFGARVWKLEFGDAAPGPAGVPINMDTKLAGLMFGYMFD